MGVKVGSGVMVKVAGSVGNNGEGVSVMVGTGEAVCTGDRIVLIVVGVGNLVGWADGRHPKFNRKIPSNKAAR